MPFQKKVAFYGCFNSLAQTLLKATCPGIPDFYQGTELWDLNLVDPDNRRPINFQLRQKLLAEIIELKPAKAPELLQTPTDGRVKLYVIYKLLQLRRKSRALFEQGDYIPLAVKGTYAEHVVAFCRKKDNAYAITVALRFPIALLNIKRRGSSLIGQIPTSAYPREHRPDGAKPSPIELSFHAVGGYLLEMLYLNFQLHC